MTNVLQSLTTGLVMAHTLIGNVKGVLRVDAKGVRRIAWGPDNAMLVVDARSRVAPTFGTF